MQREELDQVRRLYRLFLSYERVEAAADRLPAGERAALVPALADLSRRCWRQLFGAVVDAPAHRRFVLEWCLRNVELLMKEQVLPVIAHQVVAHHIQTELAGLPEDASAPPFASGPSGTVGTALRRVYLIQSLTILLARLALEGQIPARLQAHLMGHLVKRVRGLFGQCLGDAGADPAALPDLAPLLAGFRDAGALTEDLAQRLLAVDAAAAPRTPGTGSSSRIPVAGSGTPARVPMSGSSGVGSGSSAGIKRPTPAPDELVALAAAGELMRRLRRQGSLSPEDRDRLIKRVETEMDDMIEALPAGSLDRALAGLGERLGIPVPPPRDPLATSGTIRILPADNSASRLLPTKAAEPVKSPDTSDYQWAFDLIDDLRREGAEPEK